MKEKESAERTVRDIRRKTRKKYTTTLGEALKGDCLGNTGKVDKDYELDR